MPISNSALLDSAYATTLSIADDRKTGLSYPILSTKPYEVKLFKFRPNACASKYILPATSYFESFALSLLLILLKSISMLPSFYPDNISVSFTST